MTLQNRAHEERPWGSFTRFTKNEVSTVKIMHILPGEAFSLQLHNNRDEFGRVLSGSGTLVLGDSESEIVEGDEFWIPKGTKHRITGGPNGFSYLEIWLGNSSEDDIVRLEDKYGRS